MSEDFELTIGPNKATSTVGGYDKSVPTSDLLAEMAKRSVFHTGLLPPGIRMISHAGDRTQIVAEQPPAINTIFWGRSEGDRNAPLLEVAQPWRVIIIDLLDNKLLGIRHFYALDSISHPDHQLYVPNTPNTNCNTYRGNGVGWICCYLSDAQPTNSLGATITYSINRASGHEAYNDANMSGTDGPRLYQRLNKPRFTWDPKAWEHKSLTEGIDWALDESTWIPLQVNGMDDQESHIAGGIDYTLAMAVEGAYAPYYNQPKEPKLYTTTRQGQYDPELYEQMVKKAFNMAANSSGFSTGSRLLDRNEVIAGSTDNCVICRTDTTSTRAGHHICTNCKKTYRCCQDCGRELETKVYFRGRNRICNECRT